MKTSSLEYSNTFISLLVQTETFFFSMTTLLLEWNRAWREWNWEFKMCAIASNLNHLQLPVSSSICSASVGCWLREFFFLWWANSLVDHNVMRWKIFWKKECFINLSIIVLVLFLHEDQRAKNRRKKREGRFFEIKAASITTRRRENSN